MRLAANGLLLAASRPYLQLLLPMPILLCAATTAEIEPTLQFIEQQKIMDKVEILLTGVGLMAATYHITKSATFSKPHIMIQAGVAGCFDESIPLGTTAVVLRESIGDLGVLQNSTFTSAFDLGLMKPYEHPWTSGKLENPHTELVKEPGFVLADSVTVNEVSTNADRISYYKNGLGATCETMEGAALHFVGLMENIPFLQLRSFCNYVGERDKEAWKMRLAIENVNAVLQTVLLNHLQP
jgi:futalosine hydrolase